MCEYFMEKALQLAKKGNPSPNPFVGAVIVKNRAIIAEGYHKYFGGHHAEIEAFNNISDATLLEDAVLYVTLEPCSHFGKTPPCAEAILKYGIKKVIVASLDPNPLVSGKGVQFLRNHGVEVIVGVLENEAKILNEAFFKYMSTQRPFVLAKMAMTLDGKIATSTGESTWISSLESREEVHWLRHKYTAIMIGVGTVLKDNPMLTARVPNGRDPLRIIVDTHLRTPTDSNLIQTASQIKTIIATSVTDQKKQKAFIDLGVEILVCKTICSKIDLDDLMTKLGQQHIDSILLEGGGELLFSAMKNKIVDKIRLYIAPKFFGGNSYSVVGGEGLSSINDAFELSSYTISSNASHDIIIDGYF
ncbi:MAG: bifunctional diaminohydroxyphosphoribosylaminopyrimidine deaminase/5-amino-6-(5-phosphoribosylamino)uracil reductase RibD [Brevinema sp.]